MWSPQSYITFLIHPSSAHRFEKCLGLGESLGLFWIRMEKKYLPQTEYFFKIIF